MLYGCVPNRKRHRSETFYAAVLDAPPPPGYLCSTLPIHGGDGEMMTSTSFDLDGGTLTIEDDRLTARLTMADIVGALTAEERAGMRAYFTDADEIRAFTTRLSLGDCFYCGGDADAADARAKFLDEINDGHTHDLRALRLAAESAKERANTLSANVEAWLDTFGDGTDFNRMRESFRSFCIQRAYAVKG